MILNTRPRQLIENVDELLLAKGFEVYPLPVFAIEPVDFHMCSISCDIAIFVSANAVDCFFLDTSLHAKHLIAVGMATQHSVMQKGYKNVITPGEYNSEGLLALPLLQKVSGQSIVLICGENPKLLLQETLETRGAHITAIRCYRRTPIFYDMKSVFAKLLAQPIEGVLSGSLESLQQLMILFKNTAHRAWLLDKKLYAMTPNVLTEGERLGFQGELMDTG